MNTLVAHLDADAFFASVEQAADTRLRGRPVAVGGERRGIIASASYEARRYGVYSPMPTALARRLCPGLIILPGDFEKYEQFSRWMFSYAYDFTPEVEIGSIDEGWFSLAGVRRPPLEVAATIREAIRQSLKITVSEGIGRNKLVSQIASKLNKPGVFRLVPPGEELRFLGPLPNRWLPGVGPRTAARLNAAGLPLIRHVAALPVDLLSLLVGSIAPQLSRFARGEDDRPLVPAREPAKSYSQQRTFARDQTDEAYLEATLRRMADELFARLRAEGRTVRTLTVRIRYNDMSEDQVSDSLPEPTDLESEVYGRLAWMLKRAWRRRVSLRMLSLKLSNLYGAVFRSELPLSPEAGHREARHRLAEVVDRLRQEHGRSVILRGHDLLLRQGEPDPTPRFQVSVPSVPWKSRSADAQRIGRPIRPLSRIEAVPTPSAVPRSTPARSRFKPPVPLVVRSHYSFLNSTLSVADIVRLATEQQLPAVALCDQGNLHGAVEFFIRMREAGLHPVLGAELRCGGQRLWLYVENATGYENLCRLLSSPAPRCRGTLEPGGPPPDDTRPPPGQPVEITEAVLQDPARTAGLIAVSPDPRLEACFRGRFYRALTTRRELRAYRPGDGPPAVPVAPVQYASPAERWKLDILQSIRTLTLLNQPHPEKSGRSRGHFRTAAEWAAALGDHPELAVHTREIAERCRFAFALGRPQFPPFRTPDGTGADTFLRRLVLAGLARRYPPARQAALRAQLEEELRIIHEVGYEELFLLTWDLLRECRKAGIPWITRGSAADSLVCYCLGISNVCPVRFDLYFRRFLNRERMALNKLPDIDIDFPHDRKDEVVDLLFRKHGPEHCAVVGGFSTFRARSAFAEVAKVLGLAEREVRRFTEHFPWSFGPVPDPEGEEESSRPFVGSETPPEGRLAALLRSRPETRDLPLEEEPYRTALTMAEFLEGVPRHPKMHPCGVVLSRDPIHRLTPTFVSPKGWPTTHLDMEAVEAVGLVKMDILAQGGLAVMRDTQAALARRGIHVDLGRLEVRRTEPGTSLPATEPKPAGGGEAAGVGLLLVNANPTPERFDDPEVWELIAGGEARAVHHIESPAMISLARMTNVRDIDTLIALVSVIRPGAANEDKKREFTRRHQGLRPVTYAHPSLERCLRSTFGLVVYEEHILQICDLFAGLPGGRADLLRRALIKENWSVVEQIGREFAECARCRGRSEEAIAQVWRLLTGFHGYAFCKAHSTAYGVEAYQSAWLKRYFPAEFMAAVLTHGKGFYRPLVYVLEAWRLGVPLLPPWINEPGPEFALVYDPPTDPAPPPPPGRPDPRARPAIRVPAVRVATLTQRTREAILVERQRGPFRSLADFFLRVQPTREEMEALSRAGAFDGFGRSRCEQFWEIQQLAARWDPHTPNGQGWLIPPPTARSDNRGAFEEPTHLQRLQWQMELLGFPAGGHPLELYPEVAWETYCPVARLGEFAGEEVTLCGLVIEDRLHHQSTGEPMKFLTLCDWTGMVETELFAASYRRFGLATVRYPLLEVTGRVEPFDNGRGYTLRVLRAGEPRRYRR